MNYLKKHKAVLIYIAVIAFSIIFLAGGFFLCRIPPKETANELDGYTGVVLEIEDIKKDSYALDGGDDIAKTQVEFTVKITGGSSLLNGTRVTATQTIDELLGFNPKQVAVGDRVMLHYLDPGDGKLSWVFVDYHRSWGLFWLCGAFFALLIIFGRKKGVNTILALVFTCAAVFAVYIPSILRGYNIYFATIVISLFIIFMTLLLVDGASKKTLCAAAGNVGGLIVAGVISVIMDFALNLTGVTDEEALYVMWLNEASPINLRGVIFGAIVIGALGATMDVAMTIASALHELSENMDNKTYKGMLKSGMNIGRDAMSTMTNTLVLAYIGGSLSVVLLLSGSGQPLMTVLNKEMIVVEILNALAGSIGILCTIPITSLLGAFLYTKKGSKLTHPLNPEA